jgi:endonuclease/exonuclease/phosphatase family metal-dependent hydrolase
MKKMNHITIAMFTVLIGVLIPVQSVVGAIPDELTSLSVMAWNIWHGGREDGGEIGPRRVVDVIRESNVDIVAMQETYGSGEQISKALKFNFHPRGTNVSIHSRYPVVEDISVFEEFKCVGALIELPDKRRVAFYSIWLPYNKEIWEEGTRDTSSAEKMLAACNASAVDLKKIWSEIEKRLSGERYVDVPIIIAGDFNSMSHRDYIESAKDQFGIALDWPTSRILEGEGFHDSWRESQPEVDRKKDRTWTPRFPNQEQDRIDYIYYRGESLITRSSEIIDTHKAKFPSDHAALVTRFSWPVNRGGEIRLRIASYNIKHGQGEDGKVDLSRAASVLGNLRPDIIGLQEVDLKVQRSGRANQPQELAAQLKMKHKFSKFMDYQGGEYGLAILSRYPIVKTHAVKLPPGGEPRVALACEIELPSGRKIVAVNLHFDWVKDDSVRYEQAKVLKKYLDGLKLPYLLLGDFNDVKDSRTLRLLSMNAIEADKPSDDSFTFSSTVPAKEIDFIFASPADRWSVQQCKVYDAPKTSDHRPVMAILNLSD